MAKSPRKSRKKDPAQPTRAKAARPDAAATPDALADLLNPAINKGTAGIGLRHRQKLGLTPPPDNSWERRQDFSAAHTARKSAQNRRFRRGAAARLQRPRRSPGSIRRWRKNSGSATTTANSLPRCGERSPAKTGGVRRAIGEDPLPDALRASTSPPSGERKKDAAGRGDAEIPPAPRRSADAAGRLRRHRQPAVARQVAARGPRRNSRQPATAWTPHRPPRPEKSEGGAALRHQVRIRAEGRPAAARSTNWSRASSATTAPRCCSASPARARPSPWPR